MTHVALIIGSIQPAYGAARVCIDIAEGLLASGHTVTVITHDQRVENVPVPLRGARFLFVPRRQSTLGWAAFCLNLRRALLTIRGTELVVVSFLTLTNYACIVATLGLRSRIRLVVSEHNEQSLALTSMGRSGRAAVRMMPLMYRGAKVVCVSQAVLKDLIDKCGVKGATFTVVYNPVSAARVTSEANLSGPGIGALPAPGNYVVCVAELKPAKQQVLLIEAIARTIRPVTLVLIGDGRDRDFLVERAKSLGVSDRVIFMGRQENPWPVVRGASASLLVPRYEGFGLSAAESAAIGVLPIGLAVGGLAEVLERVGGQLIPDDENRTQAIADALDGAVSGTVHWSNVAALSWIETELEPKHVASNYLSAATN